MDYPRDVKLNTLEELEQFFLNNNIPQEKVRFFVNQDRQDAKCFGIYKDPLSYEFVVYKNKRDGSRAERYRGKDESEAVNIFFDKFRDEMHNRDVSKKLDSTIDREQYYDDLRKQKTKKVWTQIGVVAIVVGIAVGSWGWIRKTFNIPRRGYYIINNEPYYYRGGHWWYYDDSDDDWLIYDALDYTSDAYYDDYQGSTYYDTYDFPSVTTADDYEEYYSSDDDDSSDYDSYDYDSWDYDSWDSSDTDWDSDW